MESSRSPLYASQPTVPRRSPLYRKSLCDCVVSGPHSLEPSKRARLHMSRTDGDRLVASASTHDKQLPEKLRRVDTVEQKQEVAAARALAQLLKTLQQGQLPEELARQLLDAMHGCRVL